MRVAPDAGPTGAAVGAPPGLTALRARFAAGPVGVADLLGMRPVEVEAGRVTFACTTDERFANPMGTVHGGIIATLLDSALGCAVQTVLGEAQAYTTVALELKYLRPVHLDTGELRATGTVVHTGRRQATADGMLTDAGGRVLATATTTCLVIGP
jgi:acyl-CoA thioesterase